MKHRLFLIRDTKAELYSQLLSYPANGVALRQFADAVNDKGSDYGKHPEDYNLFQVGEYDDQTGVVTMNKEGHVSLGNGLDWLQPDATTTLRRA